jgi:hypothetical protein
LCYINSIFAPDIKFYLSEKGIDYIYNDAFYEPKSEKITKDFKKLLIDTSVVHVFIPKTVSTVTTFNIPGYYSVTDDVIVIAASGLTNKSQVLAHEIGHLLSLPHPFPNFELFLDPFKSGQKLPDNTECMNGKNCKTKGDGFCDTPPDLIEYISSSSDCKKLPFYVFDNCGDTIKPIMNLLMSYRECDKYVITPEQWQAIYKDLDLGKHKHFPKNYTGSTLIAKDAALTKAPVVIQKNANNTSKVLFEWSKVANAKGYILQVASTSTFSALTFLYSSVTENLSQEVILNTGKKYFWRVLPFSAVACDDWTKVTTQNIASVATDEAFEADFSLFVYPNPVQKECFVNIESEESKTVQVQLLNLQGEKILDLGERNIQTGENTLNFSVENLPTGMYFLHLFEKNKKRIVEKIIVGQ